MFFICFPVTSIKCQTKFHKYNNNNTRLETHIAAPRLIADISTNSTLYIEKKKRNNLKLVEKITLAKKLTMTHTNLFRKQFFDETIFLII